MRKIALLFIFCVTLFNFWPTRTHVYLVKLIEVPLFCSFADNHGFSRSIYVRNQNVWWRSGWNFDALLKANSAYFEDLYPDNNDDNDMGRWIVVTSKTEIASILKDATRDVEIVEDGDVVFSIDRLGRCPIYDYANGDNPPITDDKTWGIRIPKIQEGLDILKPTREILVGVVDTGCDLKHQALKDKLVQGHNFAGGDVNDPSNRASYELHATHVTGTIVARKCPKNRFFGIANSVAKVMPIRVLNENGSGTATNVSRGVAYAANHGCHVINMSLGGSSYSKALHDAVKDAVKKGVLVVCAKGTSNSDKPQWPAEFPEVIRVTATSLLTDGTETRAPFSNFGKTSTCAAPGHFTFSTLPNGKYGFLSGTSMATPHVTACAAVILSECDFTPEQVKAIIETKGDKLCTDQPIGLRINLLKFVANAKTELMALSLLYDFLYYPGYYTDSPYELEIPIEME